MKTYINEIRREAKVKGVGGRKKTSTFAEYTIVICRYLMVSVQEQIAIDSSVFGNEGLL
jgi:hypothetical protein